MGYFKESKRETLEGWPVIGNLLVLPFLFARTHAHYDEQA